MAFFSIISLEECNHRKFHLNIAAHTKLPYKQWWLDQKDPFILSREKNE